MTFTLTEWSHDKRYCAFLLHCKTLRTRCQMLRRGTVPVWEYLCRILPQIHSLGELHKRKSQHREQYSHLPPPFSKSFGLVDAYRLVRVQFVVVTRLPRPILILRAIFERKWRVISRANQAQDPQRNVNFPVGWQKPKTIVNHRNNNEKKEQI